MNLYCENIYQKLVVKDHVSRLLFALHRHEPTTYFHCCRTAKLALQLAYSEMGMNDLEVLGEAAILHDVGKLMIDKGLLCKPGKLTTSEYEIINQHACNGAAIVRSFGVEEKTAFLIANHHLENSTPSLNHVDSILRFLIKAVRIDAWMNERPYKRAFPKQKVTELLFLKFPDGLSNERAIQFIESG